MKKFTNNFFPVGRRGMDGWCKRTLQACQPEMALIFFLAKMAKTGAKVARLWKWLLRSQAEKEKGVGGVVFVVVVAAVEVVITSTQTRASVGTDLYHSVVI
jgi:hypothetical protein